MIVLNLACSSNHGFEGWFDSNEEFERQSAAGSVACPICGDNHVVRLPSGPHVKRARTEGPAAVAEGDASKTAARKFLEMVQALVRGSEDVGRRFPEEARKIHYEEVPARNIRGIATLQETAELIDEGVQVLPLPIPPRGDVH